MTSLTTLNLIDFFFALELYVTSPITKRKGRTVGGRNYYIKLLLPKLYEVSNLSMIARAKTKANRTFSLYVH